MITAKRNVVSVRLVLRALELVERGNSDAYIESVMWAERDMHTSLLMVTNAITVARAKTSFTIGN